MHHLIAKDVFDWLSKLNILNRVYHFNLVMRVGEEQAEKTKRNPGAAHFHIP